MARFPVGSSAVFPRWNAAKVLQSIWKCLRPSRSIHDSCIIKICVIHIGSETFDICIVYNKQADIINYRGYPCEIHHVVTEDGYILELVRIPALKLHNSSSEHKAIYLQHGLLASAHVWLLAPNNSSLGKKVKKMSILLMLISVKWQHTFLRTTAMISGWVIQGETFTRENINFFTRIKQNFGIFRTFTLIEFVSLPTYNVLISFWLLRMHELGHYDIPASIAYVLGVTQQRKLIYIGHSLGCTIFHIAMIQHPQLNDKIDFMIGLAPTASVAHLNNWLKYLTPFMSSFRVIIYLKLWQFCLFLLLLTHSLVVSHSFF